MALYYPQYDIVEALNSLDETINFGIRAMMDNSLYEVGTLAVIQPSDISKTTDKLKIVSHYHQGRVFFSINQTLRIMKENNMMVVIGSFEFDHTIETFSLSPCGKFILICTQDGKITIRNLSYTENDDSSSDEHSIIFEEKFDSSYSSNGMFFMGSFVNASSDKITFYVVTYKGLVKKILLEKKEDNICRSENMFNFNQNINICSFGYPYLCLEGNEIIMANVESKSCQFDDAVDFKSITVLQSNFFASDIEGNIYIIDPLELLIFCVNDRYSNLVNRFDDLIFVDDEEKKNQLHALGLTKDLPEKKREIQLMTFPELNVVYSIPLEGPVHLIKVKDLAVEVMFFTEIQRNNFVPEIRLQVVIEANPEIRVIKLIQKNLFDEAEAFALTFDVNPNIVAKAKAQHIVNKIICTTGDIDKLLTILDSIDDQLFRLNCCDIVDCKFETDTRRVLRYGAFMNINVKDCLENRDNELLKTKTRLNDKFRRLNIFMEIYNEYDNNKFKYFVDSDLLNEMKIFLTKSKFDEATAICTHLDRTTLSLLNYEVIEDIIYMMKEDPLNRLFLSSFVPISLKYVPDSFPIFVQWLHNEVYQAEKQHGVDFPEHAIKFIEEFSELMKLPNLINANIESSQNKLKCLLNGLRNLKLLSKFGIILPLVDISVPANAVKSLINANLDPVNFEELMRNFVCPFILKSNLKIDLVLIQEIQDMFIYEEEYWIDTVQVLMNFITNLDQKLELTYKILEITNVPWSDKVKNIARNICQLATNNPGAEKIIEYMSNERILIVLRKYDIQRTQFETLDDKIFYFNRMIYLNRPSLLEDIHDLCLDNQTRLEADLLIIKKLLYEEKYEEVMKIIDEHNTKNMTVLCKSMLKRCLGFATEYKLPKKFRNPYSIVLNLVWSRLNKCVKNSFQLGQLKFDYKIADGVYKIEKHFNMQVKIGDLFPGKRSENLLNTLIQKEIELHFKSDHFNFDTFLVNCQKLADIFEQNLDTLFLKYLVNCKNFNPFLEIGKYLLKNSECSKVLCCWALYLFKYSKQSFSVDWEESFVVAISNASKNEEDYLVGIQLAKKLSIKAMIYATPEDHSAVMEVIRWIDCCFYLTNCSKNMNTNILHMYPSIKVLNHGAKSFEAIKSVFNIYTANLVSTWRPNTTYLTYFTTDLRTSQNQFCQDLEAFMWNINTILEDGQHITALNVIKAIQQGFLCNINNSENVILNIQSLIQTKWVPKILEAILAYKYVDKNLLLNVLLLCQDFEKQISHYLNVYKRQPNKLIIICQVGMELLKYRGNKEGKEDLQNILNLCKWWMKLTNKNISYPSFFTVKSEERLELLVSAEQLDLLSLPEYCIDFNLDLEKAYGKYLETILKSWKPGDKQTKLNKKCQNILKYIKNPQSIVALLDHMWPLVNFYHYEIFMVMLSIRSKLAVTSNPLFEAYHPLLSFLQSYKRISNPSRSEVEQWFGTFPFKAFIDPLSKCRLPFTNTFFSSNIWTIIKPEVSLDTYKEWFKVVPILEKYLNINDICTYAINSALPAGLSDGSCDTWQLYPKYDYLITKVEECAKHITDLERATAAVYSLMCSMPPGIDRVRMAELSYKYAQVYRQSICSNAVEKVYVKVKQRYFNYSTIHILHKYQLVEGKYLSLVAQPDALLTNLYNDPRIPQKICRINFNCPDINKAVEELCSLYGWTAKQKKLDVLSGFLKSNSTLELDLTYIKEETCDVENEHLLRAYYICGSTDFRKFLLKIGMNENTEHAISFRSNALKCFYYTSDMDTIQEMSKKNPEQFLSYTNKVSVIAKINELGFTIKTVEQLDEFNKKKLLKELAKLHKPLGIKCIASICKIYGYDDLKYWEFIVNTAIQFNMIKDLVYYVEHLRFRCPNTSIINAWNLILSEGFTIHVDINKYAATLRFLQTCPVIYELNFEKFIEKSISNKRLEIAAVLLQYISKAKQDAYLQIIVSQEGIAAKVAKLKDQRVLGIDKVINIMKEYQYKIESQIGFNVV